MCQHHLLLGHLRDPLLHRGPRHVAVNHHLVGLTNTVSSTKRLRDKYRKTESYSLTAHIRVDKNRVSRKKKYVNIFC